MEVTKNYIRRLLYSGQDSGYSHLVILLDRWDYEYLPKYISRSENIDDVLKEYIYPNSLWKVVEIYNYDMDLEYQLQEDIPMHKISNKEEQKDSHISLTNNTKNIHPLIVFISSLDNPSDGEKAFFDNLESGLREHQKRLRK